MSEKMINNSNLSGSQTTLDVQKSSIEENVSVSLLNAIKSFINDLLIIVDANNVDFSNYYTIVNRIDETKIKSYIKLVTGFRTFFSDNQTQLTENNFGELATPNITYISESKAFSFDFKKIYEDTDEDNQEIIKDHLNHIWNLLNNLNKSPEEVYIDKIFVDLKSKFEPDLSRDQQMIIAKELFSDFQKQNLDISLVIKIACKKARELLLSNGSDEHSKTLLLIDAVEEIDINNFNMIQFLGLVGKVGTLFSEGESNPLNGILASVFSESTFSSLPIEDLKLDE